MKKTHAILIVLIIVALGVFAADWSATKVQTIDRKDSVDTDAVYPAQYSNEMYGFSFEYNPALFKVDAIEGLDIDTPLRVSVSPTADNLSGLAGLLNVQISKKPFKSGDPVNEFIGTVEVLKHEYSIAGGNFVLFEKKNTDGTYIHIELPKEYADMTFDVEDDLDTMMELSVGLQDIINSFEFNETNTR